jgi:hypothetical protein
MLHTNLANNTPTEGDAFSVHQGEFLSRINEINQYLPYQDTCYSPYPLVVPNKMSHDLQVLAELLLKAVSYVAVSYVRNERIRAKMPLPSRFNYFLERADKCPYKMGTIRPDLIFGHNNRIKICEINARFPLNGMTISQWVNSAADDAHYLSWNDYQQYGLNLKICSTMLARFPTDQTLVRVAKSETGGESRFFLDQFSKHGGHCVHVRPEQLAIRGENIVIDGLQSKGAKSKGLSNFILEIDREELLSFAPNVINKLIDSSNYINDVRTLILVHDKRILTIISDPEIMQPFLSDKEHRLLKNYLLGSAELSLNEDYEDVLLDRKKWVLKKSSGGRGLDLFIGATCSQKQWENVLKSHKHQYMAQEYFAPSTTPISHFRNGQQSGPMNIVGSLPCFDSTCFGIGMFRASEQECVNIGNGEGQAIFLPSAEANKNNSNNVIYQALS